MNHLTILVCTHKRADLLALALASLNAAQRPVMPVQILVVANACTDNTAARMLWGHMTRPRDEAFNRERVVYHFLGLMQGLYQSRYPVVNIKC
jgi:hypothetical protein